MVEILRTVVGLIGLAIFTEQTVSPSAVSGDMGRPLRGVEDRGGVHAVIGRCKGTRGIAPRRCRLHLGRKADGYDDKRRQQRGDDQSQRYESFPCSPGSCEA